MAEKRRGLGRGISALIPQTGSVGQRATSEGRPVDVFFPDQSGDNEVAEVDGGATESAADEPTPTAAKGDAKAKTGSSGRRGRVSVPPMSLGSDGKAGADADDQAEGEDVPATRSASAGEPQSGVAAVEDRSPDDSEARSAEGLVPVPGATFAELPVEQITPNSRQPRQVFDEDDLDELTSSIAEVGLLQPIVVRPRSRADVEAGETPYELVMGERRWRATQRAGLTAIPAIIRTTTDDDLLRDALLENLHRAQLNPLEEASAYQQLLEDFACTHEELARRIARSRPQISNTIRLLKLPPLVQRRVASGVLSAGHARALLGLPDAAAMERLAQRIVAEGLSVRSTEEIVALGDEPVEPEMRRRKRESPHSENLSRLSYRLADRFDTRVKVTMGQRKGKITIEFAGAEDLERILGTLAPGDSGLSEPSLGDGDGGGVDER